MPRRPPRPWSEPQYGPNRYAWLGVGRLEFITYVGVDKSEFVKNGGDDEEEEPEPADYAQELQIHPIRWSVVRHGRKPLTLNLTYYTEEELVLMKEHWNEALDLAIERAKILDAKAQELFEAGDDTIPRLYRATPSIIRRPRVLTRPYTTTTMKS